MILRIPSKSVQYLQSLVSATAFIVACRYPRNWT